MSIEGPKWVGKTETAQRRANTDYRLDGPAGRMGSPSYRRPCSVPDISW